MSKNERKLRSIEDQLKNIDPSKKTICAITINSVDEKEVFSQRLSNFNVVELADRAYSEEKRNRWIDHACKSDLKCDILVVSGHFGGSFFGGSGFKLSTEKMEELMCKKSCEGVFNHPKEVFLFGCNTLAGKSQDHRSSEEYIEVLLEDGFSVIEAQEVAAFRYSPIGSSFHDRMTRVFSSVPKIYGFDSVGPSGKNVRHMLEKYFDYIPNYENHLQSINHTQNNKFWSKALRVTTQNQSAGVVSQDEASKDKICLINSDDIVLHEKWKELAGSFTNEEELLTNAPALFKLVDDLINNEHRYHKQLKNRRPELSELEKKYKNQIATNPVVQNVFRKYLKKYIPGMLGIRAAIYQVSEYLKIFEKKELSRFRLNLIGNFKNGINRERSEVICSYDNLTLPTLTLDDLPSGKWDIYETWAVICLGVTDSDVVEKVFFENVDSDFEMATNLLLKNGYSNEKIVNKLVEKFPTFQKLLPDLFDEGMLSDSDWDNYDNYDNLVKSIGLFRGGKNKKIETLIFENDLWDQNNIGFIKHLIAMARYIHQAKSFDEKTIRKILTIMYPKNANEDYFGSTRNLKRKPLMETRSVLDQVFLENKLCDFIDLAEEYEKNIPLVDIVKKGDLYDPYYRYHIYKGKQFSLEPEKYAVDYYNDSVFGNSSTSMDLIKISLKLKKICSE